MEQERRRAALAALCVLAVAVAAALFPAGGFGSQPAGVGGADGQDVPSGSASGSDPSHDSTDGTDPQTVTTTDESPSDSDDSNDGGPTETTTTNTTTTVTDSGYDPAGPGGLLLTVALTALGLVVLVGLVGIWTGTLAVAATAGLLPFTVVVAGTPVGELVGHVPSRTMALVVGFSSWVPRLLDDAADLTRAVAKSLAAILGSVGRASADALRIVASGLAATAVAVPRALAGLGAGAGVLASLGDVGVPSVGGRSEGDNDESSSTLRDGEPDETGPPSVEEAWRTMRDRVPVGDPRTRTPGEVARAAVRRGYPDEAVRRLTDAFREVRYGGLPRGGRTESARSALDRLRDHWRDDE